MKIRIVSTALLSFFISLSFASIVPDFEKCKSDKIQQSTFLKDLFKNIDKEKLKNKDEEVVIKYITEKNIEIKNYLLKTYPNEEFESLDVNDPGTLIIGLMTGIGEDRDFKPFEKNPDGTVANRLPTWAACAMEVITGAFDLVGLYHEYVALFTSSAVSWSSVASIVGRTLKRHFGWIAAAYLVYDIATTCL